MFPGSSTTSPHMCRRQAFSSGQPEKSSPSPAALKHTMGAACCATCRHCRRGHCTLSPSSSRSVRSCSEPGPRRRDMRLANGRSSPRRTGLGSGSFRFSKAAAICASGARALHRRHTRACAYEPVSAVRSEKILDRHSSGKSSVDMAAVRTRTPPGPGAPEFSGGSLGQSGWPA